MSKRKNKKNKKKYAPENKNSDVFFHMSSEQIFEVKKPHYNGYLIGHGVIGDTSYNRTKQKRSFRKMLREEW